jgi:hypothetical protein
VNEAVPFATLEDSEQFSTGNETLLLDVLVVFSWRACQDLFYAIYDVLDAGFARSELAFLLSIFLVILVVIAFLRVYWKTKDFQARENGKGLITRELKSFVFDELEILMSHGHVEVLQIPLR